VIGSNYFTFYFIFIVEEGWPTVGPTFLEAVMFRDSIPFYGVYECWITYTLAHLLTWFDPGFYTKEGSYSFTNTHFSHIGVLLIFMGVAYTTLTYITPIK
jgi:hypothetical protein